MKNVKRILQSMLKFIGKAAKIGAMTVAMACIISPRSRPL